MSKVMQVQVKKRIKMSPREAVIRNSSCDEGTTINEKVLQDESQLTVKVLLRHQNKTTMDWKQTSQRSNDEMDEDQESIFVKDDDQSEFNTIFNQKQVQSLYNEHFCRLLRIRKDQKGKPLKRSMLGSVEDFIESYRKKSPPSFAVQT